MEILWENLIQIKHLNKYQILATIEALNCNLGCLAIPCNYLYLHNAKYLPFACHGYRVDKRELRRHADVSMYICLFVSESVDRSWVSPQSGFFPSLKYGFWLVKVKSKAPKGVISVCPTKERGPRLSKTIPNFDLSIESWGYCISYCWQLLFDEFSLFNH